MRFAGRIFPVLLVIICTSAWAAVVRSPSEAAAVVEALLSGRNKPSGAHKTAPIGELQSELPRFAVEVRMVNLLVSATDGAGHPVKGLAAGAFRVFENGVEQDPAFVASEEVAFNLALLLDLSGSTLRDRNTMKLAARRLIEIARPQDKIAVYALAADQFRVIAPLDSDRTRLLRAVETIPDLEGSTPLYASIALAWDQELAARPSERNALVVISDGLDDSLEGKPTPLVFARLLRAVPYMPVLIYPIYLDSQNIFYGARARRNMEGLARASGARILAARSAEELEPAYAALAEELRSVYTLAYYPKNQNFDGGWRRVEVRCLRPGVRLRVRQGYYAR